jgi:hypothetical protein
MLMRSFQNDASKKVKADCAEMEASLYARDMAY